MTTLPAPDPSLRFAINRQIAAPRPAIWAAWTDPAWIVRWWLPGNDAIRVIAQDVRPGGLLLYAMDLPRFGTMHARMAYREVEPGVRIVAENGFADAAGAPMRPPFDPNWPIQNLLTLTLSETPGGTLVEMVEIPLAASEREREVFTAGMPLIEAGWGASFDRLAQLLAGSA